MSDQGEIKVSYDVSNEFFSLWLDQEMNYTCAVYEDNEDLETAQQNKLRWLSNAAGVGPDKRVLDIGCGWGACLAHLAREQGVTDSTGITLSPAQHDYAIGRNIPGANVHCVDYRDFQPQAEFDAVISICMMEHVATPEQARSGEHIGLYRDFFQKVHSWTRPGARFALQSILRDRVPRNRKDLEDVIWVTYEIFPGGISMRLEDIVRAASGYWEIETIQTRRDHYRRTTAEWLRRLEQHEDTIRQRWGDHVFVDYQRYLSTCVTAFEKRYQSLAQFSLKRIDN